MEIFLNSKTEENWKIYDKHFPLEFFCAIFFIFVNFPLQNAELNFTRFNNCKNSMTLPAYCIYVVYMRGKRR